MALTDGLLAFYPLNNSPNDTSGNGHHLTVTGAVFNTPGLVGSHHLYGDGIDDKASNSDTGLDGLAGLTLSCFFSRTTGTGNSAILIKGDRNTVITYAYGFVTTGNKIVFIISKGSAGPFTIPALATITLGQTYHLFGTWNGTTMEFFINNVSQGTNAFTGPMNNINDVVNPLLFLKDIDWGSYINGKIDAAGIWNRALTADERAELYNGGAGLEDLAVAGARSMRPLTRPPMYI